MSQDEQNQNANRPSKVLLAVCLVVTIGCSLVSMYYNNKTQEAEKAKFQAASKRLIDDQIREKAANLAKATAVTSAAPDPAAGFRLQVLGKGEFSAQTMKAMQLIWQYDKPVFTELKQYVYVIREGDKTTFMMENNAPTIVLTSTTAYRSTTWCAGALARQFFHAKRYYEREKIKHQLSAPPEPGQQSMEKLSANPLLFDLKDAASMEKMEKEADAFQVELLRRIGAPRVEIALIENRTPFDYSLVSDGQ